MAAQHAGTGHVPPSANGGPAAAEHHDMEDSKELMLMRAFAQRRRPGDKTLVVNGNGTSGNGPAAVPPSSSLEEAEPKKKQKKKKTTKSINRRLLKLFSCGLAGRAEAAEDGRAETNFMRLRGAILGEVDDQVQAVDELAAVLIERANISFIPPEIESDAEEGEIEKLAGLLLRQCGDMVAEDYDCAKIFQELLSSYGVFGSLMSTVFRKIGLPTTDPRDRGPKDSDEIKTNIAVTCEVASRLSAMDTHPMSRVLGFGARYLKEHYPLEAAFSADEDSVSAHDVE